MEMLYKISIEPNPIKRSIRSQMDENRPRESHPHIAARVCDRTLHPIELDSKDFS